VVLVGCGSSGDEGARSTLSPVEPTAYVTVDPPTTTSTTIPPTPTPPPPGGSRSATEQQYTVQSSDCCLASIAGKFDITVEQLTGHNGIGLDHLLLPGQTVLRIPPGAKLVEGATGGTVGAVGTTPPATGSAPTTGTTEAPPASAGCTHTIVAGENPSKVANKYGISTADLIAANQGSGVLTNFLPGDQLVIPGVDC